MASNGRRDTSFGDDPLWYKDALIYQTHVRAFYDSDGDGIGDFPGLTQKLDYLADLGVTAIWILPFYPSPLKDDGYDIADYKAVNKSYGDLRDVRIFIREAHRRGLRVITELVFNHTSDQHAWFQRARRAKPGTNHRDFYVWSDAPDKYLDARIIFKDFEHSNWSYDHVAGAYYWHRFYAHQPDLNFENPKVHEALFRAMDFWLDMGVDGLRLDAIPYLYERDGTNCENLPETHAFLKKVRAHVDANYANRMLLAEANQWPEDAVEYFGDGDECHMCFHFPVMPRIYMAVRMEDRYPIIDILDQTPPIPEPAQWAMFLRNHDELTLEMVTDEERDYMYRAYAQDPAARINLGIRRRLAPLMNNNRRRIELLKGLLFSLPGTPIIYYGDEIGMGDNIFLGDRNGVRTPMQWSGDRNAGFSTANSQRLYFPVITDPEYHFSTINVETQQANPQSLLWWMKRLIALRKRYKAFGRGSIEFLHPENRKVLAFVRKYEDETILVVANLSRFVQAAELDLSAYRGFCPVEMFGRTEFPGIGDLPYFITLGPHSFYWFALEPVRVGTERTTTGEDSTALPQLTLTGGWSSLVEPRNLNRLANLLPDYVVERRWFGGKARKIKGIQILDSVPLPYGETVGYLLIVQVEYTDGDPETYVLPVGFAGGQYAEDLVNYHRNAVIAQLTAGDREGVLFDTLHDIAFCQSLLETIVRRRRVRGEHGAILPMTTRAFRELAGPQPTTLAARVVSSEQSNTSVVYGDRLILKVFRRLEEGHNPDVEIGRYLTEATPFRSTAQIAGSLEYQVGKRQPTSLAVLQGFVHNQGDAWQYTLDALEGYFEHALANRPVVDELPVSTGVLLDLAESDPPPQVHELIGGYVFDAQLLGRRTAELHIALSAESDDPAFAPESSSMLYQRALYQSFRGQVTRVFGTLRKQAQTLPDPLQSDAQRLFEQQDALLGRFHAIVNRRLTAQRFRFHGDYHLGQVLFTGRDFIIIDFEGEPARSLSERRMKRSPLRDVAGMLRSFHYATYTALFNLQRANLISHDDPAGERWAGFWYRWVSAAFLRAYLDTARDARFMPAERGELELLLDIFLLDKAVYELGYELNNRPTWVQVPLRGILDLLDVPQAAPVGVAD
jgi:maltose alpha-D-glucosyltransferase/alpha-amylase